MALATPLPSSDDSDTFLSPVESPSQLSRSEPSPPQPPAKMKLFIGAEDDDQQTEGREKEGGEDKGEEEAIEIKMDEAVVGSEVEIDQSEGAVEPIVEKMDEEEESKPRPALPHSHMAASVRLVRVSLGSVVKGRTLTSQPPPTNSPFRPSPLTTHVHSASPATPREAGSPHPRGRTGLLTPVLTTELNETRQRQLRSSLEAIKRKHVAEYRGELTPKASVSVVKDQPSATMVRQLTKEDNFMSIPSAAMEPPVSTPPPVTTIPLSQGTSGLYGFSPPTKPVAPSGLLGRTLQSNPVPATPISAYAFSPPVTRSASRRKAQAGLQEEAPPSVQAQPVIRRRSRPPQDHVTLFTPPTPHPQLEQTEGKRGGGKRRSKPVRSVATRRSKRLLMQDIN